MEDICSLKRTHYCGALRLEHAGQKVVLMGWVQRRRDHGGLIFLDLRDRSGITQAVFSPELASDAFQKAETIRNEYVLAISGQVEKRPEGTENPNLATGEVEVRANKVRILNRAKTPPFYIEDGVDVEENVRLRYRYLDLRRPEMQRALLLRHNAARAAREFLNRHGFLEIETPMLTKSTPEGARDFLVPSRLNPGRFYALPQSPQLYKQILMVAGLERYYQIVRCFRDEDLRADRQPEFTQIDLEMSFFDRDDILKLTEEMIAYICKEATGKEVNIPFPRLTYQEAMERFGTDKPDLRFDLEIKDITDLALNSSFKVFSTAVAAGGKVKGINAKGGARFTRREIEALISFATSQKAKGLAYFTIESKGVKSPLTKFFQEEEINAIVRRLGGEAGDLLLFVADRPEIVSFTLGNLRLHLAEKLNVVPQKTFQFVWIIDFPLLEYNETEKRYVAMHHPFTSPREDDLPLLEKNPAAVRANAYDLVFNGVEIGGGSIRIHRREIQEKMFSAIGLSPQEAQDKFGFLLDAFEYGTPPHGGIAFGFDRLVMLLAGKNTIRDVIAFPKTQSAADLMSRAPDSVSPAQLKELQIKLGIK